jgi:hypothetical protein
VHDYLWSISHLETFLLIFITIAVAGETSSFECAHQLGKLCENRQLVVNLIPYNTTDVKDKLQCPSDEHMLEFRDIVQSYGSFVTIRRTMGADIASACGQLVQKKKQEDSGPEAIDIEDVVAKKSAAKNAIQVTRSVEPVTSRKLEVEELVKSTLSCWLESVTTEDLEQLERALTIASTVAASWFVVSSLIFLKQRR